VMSPEMTSPEVTGSQSPEPEVMNRNRKWKGDNFPRLSLTGFLPRFYFGNTSGSTQKLLGVSHSILTREISTNENLGNSTNEMPQSPFQLANHGSPYRSNESIRTIYFWLFVFEYIFSIPQDKHVLSLWKGERKCRFSNWKKQRLTFEFDWTKESASTNSQK
jgi:hypothetical protein